MFELLETGFSICFGFIGLKVNKYSIGWSFAGEELSKGQRAWGNEQRAKSKGQESGTQQNPLRPGFINGWIGITADPLRPG